MLPALLKIFLGLVVNPSSKTARLITQIWAAIARGALMFFQRNGDFGPHEQYSFSLNKKRFLNVELA